MQWDVPLLDEYLYSLLLTRFWSSLDPLLQQWMVNGNGIRSQTFPLRMYLKILLSAIVPAATIWSTHIQTPATKALGIRAVLTPTAATSGDAQAVIRATKWRYIVFTVVFPLIYQLLQRYVMDAEQQQHQQEQQQAQSAARNNNSHEGESNQNLILNDHDDEAAAAAEQERIQRQAQHRRLWVAQKIVQAVQKALPALKLGLLLSMLVGPTHSATASASAQGNPLWNLPPSWPMVLAGLQYVTAPPSSTATTGGNFPPRLFVLYAHRRWLYEESMQTFRVVFGPLITGMREVQQYLQQAFTFSNTYMSRSIPRLFLQLQRRILSSQQQSAIQNEDTLLLVEEQSCGFCGKKPIVIPYDSNACSHVFCYTCLWKAANDNDNNNTTTTSSSSTTDNENEAVTMGTGFPCPKCHESIQSSRPIPLQRYLQEQRQRNQKREQQQLQDQLGKEQEQKDPEQHDGGDTPSS